MPVIRRLARQSAINLLPPMFALGGMPLLARLFTPATFGEYFIAYTVATTLAVALSGMLHQPMFNGRDIEVLRRIYGLCVRFILLASLFAAIACVALAVGIGQGHLIGPGLLVVAFAAATATTTVQSAYLVNTSEIAAFERITILRPLGVITAQVATALAITNSLYGLLVPALFLEIAMILLARRIPSLRALGPKRMSIGDFRTEISEHRGALTYLMPSQLVPLVANLVPPLILQQILGTAVVGIYSMTMRLVGTPINAFTSAIRAHLWAEIRNAVDVHARIDQASAVVAGGGFLAAVIYWAAHPPLAARLLGSKWADVDSLIPLALCWMTSSVLLALTTEIVKNSGMYRQLLRGELLGSVTKIGALIALGLVDPSSALRGWFLIACIVNLASRTWYSVLLRAVPKVGSRQ